MAGSEPQHDERQPEAAPADAVREAVERTFRDAAGALQRLAGHTTPEQEPELAATLTALTKRVEALEARVAAVEITAAKAKKKAKTASRAAAKQKPSSGS